MAAVLPGLALMALALAAPGCCHVDAAKSPLLGPEVEEHVQASNYGWTLFGCIPLICGNKNVDSWCPVAIFRNDTNPDEIYDIIVQRAVEKNCDLKDIHVIGDNDVFFNVYFVPVPWVIVYKEINISANLIKREME